MAVISSVQEVEISVGVSDVSATATITSVTTANTAVFVSYGLLGGQRQTSTINGADHVEVRVDLTNSTTVTATRELSNQALTVFVTVVEFDGSVVDSIQQGTITVGDLSSSNTDTITSVNTSRSVVLYNGQTTTRTSLPTTDTVASLSLTNSTTITATTRGSSLSATVGYTVIEFATGVVDSVQEFDITVSSGTTNTATISSVVTGQSCIFPGGFRVGGVRLNNWAYAELTNSTTVTATINTADATGASIVGTVVEFNSDYIESIQRGTVSMSTSDTTVDTTITSVDVSKSIVQAIGGTSGSSSTMDPEEQTFTLEFTSSTNIRSHKVVAGRAMTLSYEVVEFSDGPAAGYANNVNGVSNANIGEVIDVLKANIDNVMGS